MTITTDINQTIQTLLAHLTSQPNDLRAAQTLLALGREHGRQEETLAQMKRLAGKHKNSIVLHGLLAWALSEAGRFAESLPYYKKALVLVPNQQADFFKNYSRALARSGHAEAADSVLEAAIQQFPHHADLYIQRANNAMDIGDQEAVEAAYRQGLTVDPDNPLLHNSLGLMRFLRSGMREGFDDYRWRHKLPGARLLPFPLPEWNGEPLEGKRLILWTEQGIGDIVMFASLLPWLQATGAALTLVLQPKLVPLFTRSFPEITVLPLAENILHEAIQKYDYHLPLGELMRLGLPHDIPATRGAHLKADPELVATLRKKYLGLHDNTTRIIGISWHTANPHTGYLRNIPLALWQPLLDLPGIQFVSLQYGDHAGEMASHPALYQDPEVDAFADTDALAAQISAMDEVITIQNATAHLGGALGVPTTLLLSVASDWRWGLNRTDSLWYDSVHIARQHTPGNWQAVMMHVATELKDRV